MWPFSNSESSAHAGSQPPSTNRRRSGGVATPQLRPFCAPSLVVSNTADGQSKPRLEALPAMDASMSNGKRFKGNGKRSKGNDKRSKGKNKKATGQAGQKNRRYGQWGSMQRMEASQGILIGR